MRIAVAPIGAMLSAASLCCCAFALGLACVAGCTDGLADVGVEWCAAGGDTGDVVNLVGVSGAAWPADLALIAVALEHLLAKALPRRGVGECAGRGAFAAPTNTVFGAILGVGDEVLAGVVIAWAAAGSSRHAADCRSGNRQSAEGCFACPKAQ
jgi:hypothetical protein